MSRDNLAVAYQAAGRTAEAIKLIEETLKLRETKLGPDHPDTLTSRNNLAWPTVRRPHGPRPCPWYAARWHAAVRSKSLIAHSWLAIWPCSAIPS